MEIDERLHGLDFVTWHLLGYEEFVAGYNDLVSRRLLAVLEHYLDTLNTVLFEYLIKRDRPRNLWHMGGVADGLDYVERVVIPAMNDSPLKFMPLARLPNYRDYTGWHYEYDSSGTCEYCDKMFMAGEGWLAKDMIQDAVFCNLQCARQHRSDLFHLMPQLQKFYNVDCRKSNTGPYPAIQVHEDWYLRPLPYNEDKLREYFNNLPAPDLDDLRPIDWTQWKPKSFVPRLK